MNTYLLIRTLHIGCAVLTLCGFTLRGYWMWTGSALLEHRLSRVLPHIIDTVLLASAIALVVMSGFYPVTTSWINYKIILLLVYIVLGTIALKRGKTPAIRRTAFLLALLSVSSIIVIARLKP